MKHAGHPIKGCPVRCCTAMYIPDAGWWHRVSRLGLPEDAQGHATTDGNLARARGPLLGSLEPTDKPFMVAIFLEAREVADPEAELVDGVHDAIQIEAGATQGREELMAKDGTDGGVGSEIILERFAEDTHELP